MGQVLINGLYTGSQYALIALGLTLIFALMNVMNFAHGQMYVLGAFVTYYFYGVLKLPFLVGMAASALALAVVGMLADVLLFRTVLARGVREESSMLLAAGVALFLESITLIIFGEKQRGVPDLIRGVFKFENIFVMPYGRLLVMGISVIAIIAFISFMKYTKQGRGLRAMAQNKQAAMLMGVDIKKYSMLGWALGGMLAAIAGSLVISVTAINSGMGTGISIKSFIMVMIGGAGVISGAIAGGFVLGMLESIGYKLMPGGETYMAIFILLLVFLAFRPKGLFGK